MAKPMKHYRWEKDPATGKWVKGAWTGKWRIRWHDASGQRQTELYATEAAARAALRRHQVEVDDIRSGKVLPKKDAPIFKTFVMERWLPTYPKAAGNRKVTIRDKEAHIRVHLMPAFGELRLDQIRGEVVDRFFADLRKKAKPGKGDKSLSEKTIKNIRATLRKILATAHDWGELEVIPSLPKVKVPESKFDYLTFDEADACVGAARNDEERALLLFAIKTGLRMGEQRALEWGDIDWHSGKIIVTGSMDEHGEVGPTKSGKGRKIPLTPSLAAALRAIKHLRGPRVFCRLDGSPLTKDQLHERLWGTLRRAGIRKIKWHELRHTYGTHLAMRNVPLRKIQELMGHATVTMTMRYAHFMPGGDEDVIAALEWSQSGHSNESPAIHSESQGFSVTPPGIEPGISA